MIAKKEQVTRVGAGSRRIRAKYTCRSSAKPWADCFCVRFSPDDEYLAASYANGTISIFNAETGKEEYVLKQEREEGGPAALPITQLRWRPHAAQSKTKSVLMSVNVEADGQICHWHIKSGKCLHTITELGNQIFCLDYFADGSQFATAGRDRLVRVYDEASKRQIMTLQGGDKKGAAGHSNRIFSLAYHPLHPHIVLSGGWDNTVQIWDTRTGYSIRSLWNCYVCGDSVSFTSDGQQILTGSWRSQEALQLWDFASGADASPVEAIEWSSATADTPCCVFAAQCSKDPESSMILAGGSEENEAKFFMRPAEGRGATVFGALVTLPQPVFSVDFAPSAHMAAIGTADGSVRVLEIL